MRLLVVEVLPDDVGGDRRRCDGPVLAFQRKNRLLVLVVVCELLEELFKLEDHLWLFEKHEGVAHVAALDQRLLLFKFYYRFPKQIERAV